MKWWHFLLIIFMIGKFLEVIFNFDEFAESSFGMLILVLFIGTIIYIY